MTEPDWIAVDWGTSHLRLWQMAADGSVLARAESPEGMGKLDPEGYEAVLARLLPDLTGRVPVVVCGMAGARQGWREAPYAKVPCRPPGIGRAVRVDCADERFDVAILPGVAQDSPADVMRGEETQVAGFLALNPGFDGVICLPGTHTKWVHISAGEIVSFRSFMTGELYALLAGQSVLRHSMDEGWDDAAFAEAAERTMSRPASLAADLFNIRAESLLAEPAPGVGPARLSGLLIGMELAAAKPYWLGQNIAVVGADRVARHYVSALESQAVPVVQADAERMTLEGLKAARRGGEDT
ncbi:2-dehydro-3-deoxygalactonokinase [Salipiger mucosus]|uniref:2-dehydro-3-deoxygalactonokinase n=1 Tax=Salipiger mucosus DSM 16094 TaxID=1123237 RepID=S9Q8D1_9RHOB|nr:2-dehydro-3-deoxygalactonokinase [Salipiger mucosus]EPX75888.1 2-dehydro-3-deoxygalactonokinase [Salipiger mucosus DSM 16094]